MLGSVQDIDIKLLRIFVAIYEAGGFTQAQSKLGLSQANISAKMSKLEGRLGARLCERGVSGFKLTPEGEMVLEASQQLFHALDEFQESVADVSSELSGEFNLGLVDNAITNPNSNIDRAIASFIDAAPAVSLNIYIGDPADLEAQVLDGRLHLAIGLFNKSNDLLRYRSLYFTEHALYCGDRHELFHMDADRIEKFDMSSLKCLDRGYIESIDDLKPQVHLPLASVSANGNIEGLALLVLSGRYIVSLPVHYARQWVDAGKMRMIDPRRTRAKTDVVAIYRKRKSTPKVTSRFLSELETFHPVNGSKS
ncbi:LysR family transcriptional regulator [Pseudomonas sp. LPB0260]|uniref:LysR family transcriptional regulator n=1 Tax=Pseudomonas sp. LPB0260 TaxID=2614442 RepID=UPI0015C1C9AB|nr:LysR family transcriptional regulator [Pseudomonas sp. LPB0260]QLC74689.1 LysR family transcriptional regulator [Pseudomonas sp. LPB0260]